MSTEGKPLWQVLGLSDTYTGNSEFICGIEYEIEQIKKFKDGFWGEHYGTTFDVHEDSSLRNQGKEVVTRPFVYETQLQFFKLLHDNIIWSSDFPNQAERYSERTSTHVHVNFKALSMHKVAQFVRLYILLEPYYFSLVNPNRKDNIYCVPLYYTFLPKLYNTNITYQIQKWHKYTAFNLLPLRTQGTIEFRHLQGTGDFEVFENWLTSIKKLYDFNLTYNVDFNSVLKNTSRLLQLFKDIFGETTHFDLSKLDDTVLDLKLSLQKYTPSSLNSLIQKMALK